MGRPKQFCREDVLDKAISIFTRKGYGSTSMRELLIEVDLNSFSLYEEFGGKDGIYLEAVDRYERQRREAAADTLLQPGSKLSAFRQYFEKVVQIARDPNNGGCLTVNSTVERAALDPKVAEQAETNFRLMQNIFIEALKQGQESGELSKSLNVVAVATYLLSSVRGLRVIAKLTKDEKVFADIVNVTLSVVSPASAALATV